MSDDKASLRRDLRRRRAETPEDLVAGWSAAINARVVALEAWQSADTVHLFIGALPGEVRTDLLLRQALAQDKGVICPRVLSDGRLDHRRVTSPDELAPSKWGLLEPDPALTAEVNPAAAHLICVPGLGFDSHGGRLGMGGGYYDRFLANTDAVRVGLAFEWQVLSHIPMQQHDQGVDAIVTELRVIEVARPRE